MSEPIRVLIADDHPTLRDGLRAILDTQDDMQVVGEAANGVEAVDRAAALRPDVVLMDLEMPVMDGFDATARIRKLGIPVTVLILTASQSPEDADRALRVGAQGYLTKDRITSELHTLILELGRSAERSAASESATA